MIQVWQLTTSSNPPIPVIDAALQAFQPWNIVGDEFDYMIHEWARYVRSRTQQMHCGSVEHRWKSPQIWYPPQPRPPEINHQRAERTERAVCQLPISRMRLLVMHYVSQTPPAIVCRRLQIRLNDYDMSLEAAKGHLRSLLTDE